MAELNDKMVKADVIALASPVYFYTVDAQLKTFIDRCVPALHRDVGQGFLLYSDCGGFR